MLGRKVRRGKDKPSAAEVGERNGGQQGESSRAQSQKDSEAELRPGPSAWMASAFSVLRAEHQKGLEGRHPATWLPWREG